MPDAYEIHDAQFLQRIVAQSAANALSLLVGTVPAGKCWTILAARGSCSVAETQSYWWTILSAAIQFPITLPAQFAVDPVTSKTFSLVREGMEVKLFGGEALYLFRDAATAGSTITAYARLIETDIQYYVELDKHKVLQRRLRAMEASSPMRSGGLLGPSSRIPAERSTREPRER